jgi:hypothetical protein
MTLSRGGTAIFNPVGEASHSPTGQSSRFQAGFLAHLIKNLRKNPAQKEQMR